MNLGASPDVDASHVHRAACRMYIGGVVIDIVLVNFEPFNIEPFLSEQDTDFIY